MMQVRNSGGNIHTFEGVSYMVVQRRLSNTREQITVYIYYTRLNSYFRGSHAASPLHRSLEHFRQSLNSSDDLALEEGLELLCFGSRPLLLCSSLLSTSFAGIRGSPDKRLLMRRLRPRLILDLGISLTFILP